MNHSEEGFEHLGTHLLRIEGDSAHLIARGTLMADDMRQLLETFDRVMSTQGRLFILYDATECTGLDPAARKVAALDRPLKSEPNLQVAFGVSTPIRILVNMLVKAQALLSNRQVHFIIFDTEAKAREYYENTREKIRQSMVGKPSA